MLLVVDGIIVEESIIYGGGMRKAFEGTLCQNSSSFKVPFFYGCHGLP